MSRRYRCMYVRTVHVCTSPSVNTLSRAFFLTTLTLQIIDSLVVWLLVAAAAADGDSGGGGDDGTWGQWSTCARGRQTRACSKEAACQGATKESRLCEGFSLYM